MEQKRALWIIAAVGIFLLVVLGAALLLYSPTAKNENNIALAPTIEKKSNGAWEKPATENKVSSENFSNENDANEIATVNENQFANENENDTRVKDMTVFSENTIIYENQKKQNEQIANANADTLIDLNAIGKSESAVTAANAQSEEKIASVKKTVFTPPVAEIEAPQTELAKASAPKVSEPAKVTTTKKLASTKASTTKSTVAKTSAPKPVTKKTQYWVQAASYTNKNGADDARTVLDSNKISADIFTHQDARGTIFYRVRIGPYTTESEAEYWKGKVSEIVQFKTNDAYITKTTVAIN